MVTAIFEFQKYYLRGMSTYRLFELGTFIRRFVALNLPEPVWVRAELAEVEEKRGHYYLSLIEKTVTGDDLIAQAKAIIWSSVANKWQRKNKTLLSKLLATGREVQLQVQVSFHEKFGLQLQVQDIDSNYTLGAMEQKRQQTIEELTMAGLLQANQLLQLALVPQRIAVISSPQAAGWQDFVTQLRDNPYGYNFDVQLFPAAVQGVQASPEIRRQLRTIERRRDAFDAIVIIRGGGARIDLADFDEKELCFAAAKMTLPIISGIGHETDQSVLDMLAHTALKTPTAAANFLIDRLRHFEHKLADVRQSLQQAQTQQLQSMLFQLTQIALKLKASQLQLIRKENWTIEHYQKQLPLLIKQRLSKANDQVAQLCQLHQLLSIESHWNRGFVLLSVNDKIISTAKEIAAHNNITAHLKDGEAVLKQDNQNP